MNANSESLMLTEARSAAVRVRDFFRVSTGAIDALAAELRQANVRSIITVARGSSDHAASHFAYLLLTRMGVLVTSMPPSAITLHDAPIDPRGVAAIAFSQSGQSPDLVAALARLRERGVPTAAFVNDVSSPLAQGADYCIDLAAGAEHSVAATKSFVAQLVAGIQLVASWSLDESLKVALTGAPDVLERATAEDWSAAIAPLVHADRLLVVSRGACLAVAAEMALKFKEVCGIQAEAFSAAEVKHGPLALIGAGYPLLVIAPRGPEQGDLLTFAAEMRGQGARVLLAAAGTESATTLSIASGECEVLDGMSAIQSFYVMVEALARARGLDPDQPPRLKKVTLTH